MRNPYTIFGKESCSYCTRAKELLKRNFIEFNYLDIEQDEGAMERFRSLFSGAKTVPQIIDGDGNIVGGFDDLFERLR